METILALFGGVSPRAPRPWSAPALGRHVPAGFQPCPVPSRLPPLAVPPSSVMAPSAAIGVIVSTVVHALVAVRVLLSTHWRYAFSFHLVGSGCVDSAEEPWVHRLLTPLNPKPCAARDMPGRFNFEARSLPHTDIMESELNSAQTTLRSKWCS